MNESVVKILNEQVWYLGTYAEEPNVVPVGFKEVTEEGKLIVYDVLLDTTVKNVKANGKIVVSVCNVQTTEGYQIKGTAEYVTEGEIAERCKKVVSDTSKGRMAAKGILIITPEKVIVTTPGPDNKKEL